MASRNEGRTIGAYRIIEQIGVGGMATVYKAYQPSMERYVAIKILPPHHAQDPQFVERFIREARTIAKLEHMNILPVHDFGEEDGTTYLVMRYLEGGTLKDIMAQGRLTLSDIANIVSQMCSALDYAHRQGVIHRDVKPANVMIDREGGSYLTDFGIAKALGGESDLTGTGVAIGTPAYMAPEQSLGKGVDARTDIYALGVILYEMVVGKAPYAADTPMAVALAHIHEPLPLPRKIDPSIPEAIENVIIKALAKEPADRYQSTSEMSAALNEAIRESVVDGYDSTLIDLVTEVITIRAKQVVEEPTVQEAQVEEEIVEEVEPKKEKEPKPKSRRGLWIGLGAVLIIAVISVIAFGMFGDGLFGGADIQATESAMRIAQATTDRAAIMTTHPTFTSTFTPTGTSSPAPSITPTKTFTRTPRPTTESRLTIYDNFDGQHGLLNDTYWEGNTDKYFIGDDHLEFNLSLGMPLDESFINTTEVWTLAPVGSRRLTRLSVEVRMLVSEPLRLSNLNLNPNISLNGPSGYAFHLGYYSEGGILNFDCHFGKHGEVYTHHYGLLFGYPRSEEWHVFRIAIEDKEDSQDLAYAGYVDGERVCYTTPPPLWQVMVHENTTFNLALNTWSERPWDQESDYIILIDDVAVYPMGN